MKGKRRVINNPDVKKVTILPEPNKIIIEPKVDKPPDQPGWFAWLTFW